MAIGTYLAFFSCMAHIKLKSASHLPLVAALMVVLLAIGCGGGGDDTSSGSQGGGGGGGVGTGIEAGSVAIQQPISLSWSKPATYPNGSPFTDIAGYKIYYGNSPRDYTSSITVSNPDTTEYQMSGLTPGTYYFTVTSFDSSGIESPYSGEIVQDLL